MPTASFVLRWAKRAAEKSGSAPRIADTLNQLGAKGWAARLDPRYSDTTVVVDLPRRGKERPGHVAMHLVGGCDQVARALNSGGWDAFEAPLPSAIAATMRRWGGTLLDVGANTGLYSLIATASRDDTRAIAFEPVPEILELLKANIDLNSVQDRVAVDDAAISDTTGHATLHLPPAQADGTIETSASLEPDFKETIERHLEVRTSTLDDAWRGYASPSVTMIKIDVEGSEARVLAGARGLIEQCLPVLSVEVLDRVDPGPLEALRSSIGYVDIALTATRALVGGAAVAVVPDAPNHLLVPPARLAAVVEDLAATGLTISSD